MASIIEGYSYDIFISYRQKDNKGDRWISEFVEVLKTELESTFKEEISVYFDINPHDGLLETHDVDASLKEKLKCLVFIPIISRTYCDPKSFAWEHEFKPFVEQASQDQFGLKVKLPNGNVASRVLPIRIYDLDTTDIKLCETVLGGILRGLEFIYKSSGVNRPLRSKEENPQDNLNHTIYRDQINKVGNAVKEIISGLLTEPSGQNKEKVHGKERSVAVNEENRKEVKGIQARVSKRKLLPIISFLTILVIGAILAYPKISQRNTLEKLSSSGERISVAVMPFQNMTNDTLLNVWEKMIQDNLITLLSNSEELKVRQAESISTLLQNNNFTNNASITPSIASTISQKLDANVFVLGSINQMGKRLRLNVKMVDPETEEVLKSFQIDGTDENIRLIIDSLSMQLKNFLIISKLRKDNTPEDQKYMTTPVSPRAYKLLMDGRKVFAKFDYAEASKMYLQAIAIDSNFVAPYLKLIWAYEGLGLYGEAKKWCLRAYEKKNLMSMPEKIEAEVLHAVLFETNFEVIGHLKQQLEFDDQQPIVYNDLGAIYMVLRQYDKAVVEYNKSLEIYNKWDVKPFWYDNYGGLIVSYYKTGQYKKAKKVLKKAEQDFPDSPRLIFTQASMALIEGDTVTGNEYIQKYISLSKEKSVSEANIAASLASIFTEFDLLDMAEKYYRQALSLDPENPGRLNSLAYFLIDKERNINEGIILIDTALNLRPDNYNYLNTKGWGLYKQGKKQEALDVLQESWDLRRQKAVYNHTAFLHLEEAKKAVAGQR